MGEQPVFCSIYCEHNHEDVCGCGPCAWIRENIGFVHEPGCAYTDPPKGVSS